MSLPIVDPVLIMAIAVTAFLIAPLAAPWLRLPGVEALIALGAIIGPNATGLLARDVTIELLGTVGLLYLMFVAGLELDLRGFARNRNRSLAFGTLSFLIPAAIAMVVMSAYRFDLGPALLIGAIVASHTLLAYPIAARLGIAKDAAVTTVVGGTLLTDTLSLLVLAIVDGAVRGDAGAAFWLRLALSLGGYVAVMTIGVPRLGAWFFRNTADDAAVRYLFLLAIAFGAAWAAQAAGAQPIIGAFLAGLLLNRLVPDQSTLMTRVRFVGNALFVPFFLLSVGMLVDVRVITGSADVAILAGLMIAIVLIGKGLAALAAQRLFGLNLDQGMLMIGLSVPQAAATLAVTFVGLEIGLFGEPVVNAVIVLVMVSSLVGGTMVERFGRRVAIASERAEPAPDEAPHRMLVPLANPATADALLDLAFLLRDPGAREPVFPTLVVPNEDDVAGAERLLAHAVVHAAEADVPVQPLTRIARNPASGILAAARENRATDVVLGWNGRSASGTRLFGTVIDQTVARGDHLVVIAHLPHGVATYRRVVLVMPPLADHAPGFHDAVRTIKRLVLQLGASLRVLVVQGDTTRFRHRCDEVAPQVEATFAGLTSWTPILDADDDWVDETHDLLVLLSPRRGTVAHEPWLDRFTRELSDRDGGFLVLVPSDRPTTTGSGTAQDRFEAMLSSERMVFDLHGASYSDAVERLLDLVAKGRTVRRAILLEKLLNDDVGYAAEVLPGVVIAHARGRGVPEPTLAIGLSPGGIEHRASAHRVHVLCL
ncbi:MAG: cation:proton antiporter, partial [Trueperaceae bacterium]